MPRPRKIKEGRPAVTGKTPNIDRFIYALIEPDTKEVRYVGVTYDLKGRLRAHIERPKVRCFCHRDRWIMKLLSNGKRPEMRVLETIPGGQDWQWCERFWISHGLSLGWNLTNHTTGGEGAVGMKHSPQTIDKLKENAKKRYANPEYMEKIRSHLRRMAETPKSAETIRKIVDTRKRNGKKDTDERAEGRREIARKLWENPEYREKVSKAVSIGLIGRVISPESAKKTSDKLKGRKVPEKQRIKAAEATRKWQSENPGWQDRLSETLKGRVFAKEHLDRLKVSNRKNAKLNVDEVAKIKQMIVDECSFGYIADKFGVSDGLIYAISKNTVWYDVPWPEQDGGLFGVAA